jgi:hypothetical protein
MDEREAYWGPAVARFLNAIGKPLPPTPTVEDRARWDAEADQADAEALRIYGSGRTAAA